MSSPSLSPTLDLQELFGAPDQTEWMSLTEKILKGVPFEKKMVTKTLEGIALQPVYDRTTVEGNDLADTTPGEFPFLRGTTASGYHGEAWEVCQGLPYPTPEAFNEAILEDLSRGQDSVLLQVDEKGRHGLEADTSAGMCGTHLVGLEDLHAALHEVDVTAVPLHVEAGAAASAVAGALKAAGVKPLSGSVCFDPIALLAVDGELPMAMEEAWDRLAAHVKGMTEDFPGVRSVGVDVSWSVNAGGNAVQELALMLASAAESFRALTEREVPIDTAAAQALVRFSIGSDFFMEIAKFRAARSLWAHLVKSCGGEGKACKLVQFASTSIWHQTKLDPYVNLLRATSQAFSGALGGVDGMRVDPFDAPFGLPDTFSRRIARNIQLVLRDEAHLTEVVDPAGGSWTVETLTGELCKRAWALFQEIEAQGGLLAILQDGTLQARLAENAEKQMTLLAQRRTVKVGSNQFAFPEEKKLPDRMPDTGAAATSAAKKRETLLEARDADVVSAALSGLNAASDLDAISSALLAGATFAEVTIALGGNEHTRVNPVCLGRLTMGYEALRDTMEGYIADHGGEAPLIVMAQMGPVPQHKIRSDFSQEFLKPAGFRIDANQAFATPEEAAQAVLDAGAAATVICSTDDTYPDLVPAFAQAVKAASSDTVVLMAGMMPDHTEAFRQAGVDMFIHLKANNLQTLNDLHSQTGVAS